MLLDISTSDLTEEEAQAVLDATEPARKAGMQVAAGGPIGTELSTPETESSEVIAIVAAMKQFRVGLAVAVALAGVMVMLLSPAILVLLGRGTWWIPRWLDRLLPNMDIEGEAFRTGPKPAVAPAKAPTTGGS